MDARLLAIKPPSEMKRVPRKIVATRKYWKGNHDTMSYNKIIATCS